MQTLKFSYNWNKKLDNNYFTTIRLSNRIEVGEIVEVLLNKTRLNNCKCIAKKSIFLSELDQFTATLDTGYSIVETAGILSKMYPNVNFKEKMLIVYLFKKLGLKESPTNDLFS